MDLRKTPLRIIGDALFRALKAPPVQLLWQWAEGCVKLSPKTGTFSPGSYRTRHTPHVKKVMEAFQDANVRVVVCMFAAQTGKTLTETICADWTIANDPGNSLFVMPSEQMAKSFSSTRLQRVIEDTPETAVHKVGGKGKFNLLEMEFDNCVFALAGAGSATNLASRPIKYLYLDELDKFPARLGEEGNAASLAIERTKTFPNYKLFETSTVTTEAGPINQAWETTNKNEWFCPCPECGHEFILDWRLMQFPKEGGDEERAKNCGVVCPKCGRKVVEAERRGFVTSGRWIPTNAAADPSRVGFRISEVASGIGRPWPTLVKMYLRASRMAKAGYFEELRTFVCSVLAEPWKEDTDTTRSPESIFSYCDGYTSGIVPSYMPVVGLTIGIDTQDNGFYFVVRAWGGGEVMESWLVDFGFAEGFDVLERIVTAEYQTEDGGGMHISGGFIDSQGHRTQEVYQWCRMMRKFKILPTKGERDISGGLMFQYSSIDKDMRGKPTLNGLRLARINTTFFKNWLDGKLRIEQDEPGAWHVCDDISKDYAAQMASEYRNEEGYWEMRTGVRANHYWDCEVLALARAAALRFDKSRVRYTEDKTKGESR